MLCLRCVLPVLALYLMLEEMTAFLQLDGLRQKRDVDWLDQEFSPHRPGLSESADLSLGDAGEMTRDWEGRHSPPATFHGPLERLSTHHHHNQHRRKPKMRKMTPLDPIGSFLVSNQRSTKDEPEDLEYMK